MIHRTITTFLLLVGASASSYTAPAETDYLCDTSVNFIYDAEYRQVSLTDGCYNSADGSLVCDANPRYVPAVAPSNNVDAAVEYCKWMCSSASEMSLLGLSGESPGGRQCSPCTGFFFQRHGNGHEICGFFSSDLNEATVNMAAHGHEDGSRVCIKEKLQLSLPTDSTAADDEEGLAQELLEQMGWEDSACGVNHVQSTDNDGAYQQLLEEAGLPTTLEKTLTFRINLDEIPLTSTDAMVEHVKDFFESHMSALIETNGDGGERRRRRMEEVGLAFEENVGVVDSCLEYNCGDHGLPKKSDSPAFCEGYECSQSECCEIVEFPAAEFAAAECRSDGDCMEGYFCDMEGGERRRGLRGRKLFGDMGEKAVEKAVGDGATADPVGICRGMF
jgi:hypothetical protein